MRERTRLIGPTIGYCAAFAALGLSTASLGPTLNGLAEHTASNLHIISILFVMRALGYLIGSLLGGRAYDRMPGHTLMTAALTVMAATLALAPILSLLSVLTIVMLVLGLAEGVLDVGGNTLLVWLYRQRVGPFLNALHFFFGLGAFLSPILIGQAQRATGDITWAYWLLALSTLPIALGFVALPNPKSDTARPDSIRQPINYRLLGMFGMFLFLYVGAELAFGGWIFNYAVARDLGSPMTAAYLTSAFWGALTLGRLLAVPIATRVGPGTVLFVDLCGCLAGIAIVLLWPDSQAAFWLGTLTIGFFMASIFPTTFALVDQRMRVTGRITGWLIVGASSGGMFLPWFIGQRFEEIGPHFLLFVLLADFLLAVAILTAILAPSQGGWFGFSDSWRSPCNRTARCESKHVKSLPRASNFSKGPALVLSDLQIDSRKVAPMQRKKFIWILGGVLVLGIAWYLFRPELLFINATVNEEFPSAAASDTQPTVLAKGNFHGVAHEGKGMATIHRLADGKRVLRFTDFETSNGPALHVYLVAAADSNDSKMVTDSGFVDLGTLKGNKGDQNYDLPGDTDLAKYRSVTIWCQRFSVNFATAPLK